MALDQNGDLTPDHVVADSGRKHWWQCPVDPDHEWEATAGDRTSGRGCLFCNGRRVSVTNSLAALHPTVAAQWHRTKNGSITPEQVVAGSHIKFWWQYPEAPDHEWESTLSNKVPVRPRP